MAGLLQLRLLSLDMSDITGLLFVFVMGAILARDYLMLRRWNLQFFRSGLVVLRAATPVPTWPAGAALAEVRMPSYVEGLYSRWRKLTDAEIGVLRPISTLPLLRGLIAYDPERRLIELSVRMNVGSPLFVLCVCWLLRGHWVVWLIGLGGLALDYWLERRRLRHVYCDLVTAVRASVESDGDEATGRA